MRTLLSSFLVIGIALLARAQSDTLEHAAQEAYAKGEYQPALERYLEINRSHSSAALLFNIGNCHMKLNDVPHAILYYERAIRLEPGSEDIQANLDFARTRTVDRVNELPGFTLGSLWDRLRGGKDVDQWARRSLWCVLLLALFAIVATVVRNRSAKRALYGLSALLVVLTVLSTALAWYRVEEVTDRTQAIIMLPKVDLLSEPRAGTSTLFVLHEGTKVEVRQEQGGWYEVKLSNGSVAWAPPQALVII